jgi:polyether ionophore transport system permease protein
VALFGLRPRLAAGGWAVLAVFLLLWVVEMSVKLSQPVLDVSPFSHIPKIPGEPMTAAPLAWLAAIAAALFVAGLAGFRRRDIEPA